MNFSKHFKLFFFFNFIFDANKIVLNADKLGHYINSTKASRTGGNIFTVVNKKLDLRFLCTRSLI